MSSQRNPWQLTHANSDLQINVGGRMYYRHKTTGLWWSRDTAGHGGSAFKVYREDATGNLAWFRDADQYGDFISPLRKHKGSVGRVISFGITES
jgi:hypothetical protein